MPAAAPRQSTVKSRRATPAPQGRGVIRRVVTWVAAALVGLAAVDGIVGQRGLLENMRLRERNATMAATLETLRTDNEALREQSRRLKEDPAAIEDLAHSDLGMIKDGELLVILRDVPAPTPTTSPELRQDKRKR